MGTRRQHDPVQPGVSLRDAVCRSLSSQHHLAEPGRRGLERVRDRSWESVVGQLIGHYEKVARSRTLVAA
ncbi:MAG TPA: hypothetical protein VFY98_09960 [Intrasporangium sp.]|nr:hypothetical protein [Intrasporangium sp.]